MEKKEIIQLVKESSVFPSIKAVEVAESKGLLTEGIIDSLGLMNVIAGLEKVLRRPLPHDLITVKNFDSINAITELYTILSNRQE
ncbi:MAG: hypothetical protein WBB19_01105 [Desulforhopalus sp.]